MRALLSVAPVVLALLTAASTAVAADVVVPPLVPRGSTEVRDVANITQLIGSELDFMSAVDRVVEMNKVPPGFGVSCLDSASCLRGIGQKNGVDKVFAGTLRVTDAKVTLDLVYFDVTRGRFVRRKAFDLVNKPETIADTMGDIVKEMVTGEAPKSAEDAASDGLDLLDFDDDIEVEFDADDFAEAAADEEARRRQALEDERQAKEDARRKAEDQARADAERAAREAKEAEARRKAAEEERRVAAAEAKARAEREEREAREAAKRAADREEREERERIAAARARAEAQAAASKPEPEAEFDPSMISFGSAEIQVEEDDAAEDEPVVTRRPMKSTTYYEEPDDLDLDEPDEARRTKMVDLDDEPDIDRRARDPKPVKAVKEPRTRPTRTAKTRDPRNSDPTAVQIALRGGYSPYFNLGFVTVGGEASVAVGDSGVHIIGGVQGWSTQRDIPVEFQRDVGSATEWNTIVPYNAGVVYKATAANGALRPYVGADLIAARYFVPASGGMGSFSMGARARVGADIMFVRSVGLNVDLALGGWSGGEWEQIEVGVKNAGLLPQFSAGTVIAF